MDALQVIDWLEKTYSFIRLPGDERSAFGFGITRNPEKTKKRLNIENLLMQGCNGSETAVFVTEKMKELGYKIDNNDNKGSASAEYNAYIYRLKKYEEEPSKIVVKSGIELIAEERERQKYVENFNREHDKQWTGGELANAAASYALTDAERIAVGKKNGIVETWPFSKEWWKPTPENRVKELIKAGALIAAEIDRLQSL